MHKLKPITPLGAATPCEDRIGTLVIREVVDQALASVTARKGQQQVLQSTLGKSLSLMLPGVERSAAAGAFTAFWTGPEQWMVTADHDSHEGLAAELKELLGDVASVVEQTDGWCRFDVKGMDFYAFFERLTKAPLRKMPQGAVTRTTLEHIGVFLWRVDDTHVAVIAPRSSARSLHHALITAAKSIA